VHAIVLEEAIEAALLKLDEHGAQGLIRRSCWLFASGAFCGGGGFRLRHTQQVENVKAAPGLERENAIGDIFGRITADFGAALNTEGLAAAGEEQAEIIVNFGGGGDGGARVARGVFLTNGHGWSDAGNFVDIGLFHALEKLAGVRGKGFDVTTLALGVDSVEGERGFAGAADARDYGEGVVGNVDSYVFEVVYTRTTDAEEFLLFEDGRNGFRCGQRQLSQREFCVLRKLLIIRGSGGRGKSEGDMVFGWHRGPIGEPLALTDRLGRRSLHGQDKAD
jgi:hypothetical protein